MKVCPGILPSQTSNLSNVLSPSTGKPVINNAMVTVSYWNSSPTIKSGTDNSLYKIMKYF